MLVKGSWIARDSSAPSNYASRHTSPGSVHPAFNR